MKDKFYLTTSIAYVNAPPHLGFAFELAEADVIARHRKLLGREVYFVTGTDEHGAKVVRASEKSGMDVKNFVDGNASKFKELLGKLGISNDDFIRTSDQKRHWPGAQKLWQKLVESGDIYKARYKGLYCVGHEAFITEKDLVNGKCVIHEQVPEKIEEENYFFRLSKYQTRVKSALEKKDIVIMPEVRKNEILSFIDSGLQDVSFSRPAKDISWGVPVPGDATQTMYVWADALSNYMTALGYGQDETLFNKLWPADIQIIGKDILRFHALIWPAMLFSAGLPLPKTMLVHGFINVGGRKMSKSLGNVVDPLELVGRYGKDPVRMYLLSEISPFDDGDFTEEKFINFYNGLLADSLGNTVSRISRMIRQYFDGVLSEVPAGEISKVPLKRRLNYSWAGEKKKLGAEYVSLPYLAERLIWPAYEKAMGDFEHNKALGIIFNFLGELSAYIQDYEPFKMVKTDKEKTKAVLWGLAYALAHVAWLLEPFAPDTAETIRDILGIDHKNKKGWKEFKIKESPALFPRKEIINE